MKKLMIAAALVCAAVVSHAAGFDWNFATYIEDVNGYGVNGSLTLACGDWSQVIAIEEGAVDVALTDLAYGTYTATVQIDNFLVEGATQQSGTQSGWSYTIDSLPFPGYADAEGSLAAVADDIQMFVSKDNSLDLIGSAADNGYAPVPEPTSGLLLLLGVAGLALRRRRA